MGLFCGIGFGGMKLGMFCGSGWFSGWFFCAFFFVFCEIFRFFCIFSSFSIVLYRLFSIFCSYVCSFSRTWVRAKSFSTILPSCISGSDGFQISSSIMKLTAAACRRGARFSCHVSVVILFARTVSSGPCGFRSASIASLKTANCSGSSPGISGCWAVRPCLVAFCATVALPSGVRGPVDFFAFLRFAAI